MRGNDTDVDSLCRLFGFSHTIEELRLSRLQKIMLNLIPGNVEVELQYSTTPINTQDSKGATALWWAACVGNSSLVQLLLRYDADPNIANFEGQIPMHFCYLLSYECLVDLLNHGAEANVTNAYGYTPLHLYARFSDDPRSVQSHVASDATVNDRDSLPWSPLHLSAGARNSAVMTCLLEYGAEVDARKNRGVTFIDLAIEFNSHECLNILLKAGAGCSVSGENGHSILHIAAAFADEVTLRILKSFKISGLDCDLKSDDGQTPWDIFWIRHSKDGESGPRQNLFDAFTKLLETIREENLKLASNNPNPNSEPQNNSHPSSSGDATSTSKPSVPGAWNFSE